MSVEVITRADGSRVYKVRWKNERGQSRARRFQAREAADRFDRRVKDLKAAGELHLLDEVPRGTISLREYAWEVWWPEYAEVHLDPETQNVYAVQLDLRIIPKWGEHQLGDLRSGPIEAWAGALRKQGVGDPTIIKTLTVMQAILNRAVKDEEIAINPLIVVDRPKQARTRRPHRVTPLQVEMLRAKLLEDVQRYGSTGKRIPRRDPLLRLRDATLVSVLAYSGPRPESEALPLRDEQILKRTILYRATKSGKVVERPTRLLGPLAADLAKWRLNRPGHSDELFPGLDRGDAWDRWRDRIFRPAAVAVGLPADIIPRDLRGSFASLLIYEGLNVVEVANHLGHSAQTCLRDYADVFEEFDPADRRPAEEIIREARDRVARTPLEVLIAEVTGAAVSTECPAPAAAERGGA